MKRFTLVFVNLLLFVAVIFAGPVDKQQAQKLAAQYFGKISGQKSVKFDYSYTISKDNTKLLYVFGRKDKGFVIVSADDNAKPVLGYSLNSNFPWPIASPEVKWWIDGIAGQIKQIIDKGINNPVYKKQWQDYLNGNISVPKAQVGPLVQTTWNQDGGDDTYPYNYFCPSGTPVGCVATATAQVLRYWKYPAKGRSWHTYEHPKYGRLSATFDTTNYNWNAMPLNKSSFWVALISYQLGVALDMDYDPSGSGSYTFDLTYILPNYFLYSEDIMYYTREYIEKLHSTQAWIDTLKKQIDLGYPIIYAGSGDQGGHAFVCDGYDDQNNFHFNWGWGGSYDGFFSLDNLNPGGSSFTKSQSIVCNIHPATPGNEPYFKAVKVQSPFETKTDVTRYIDAVDDNVAYSVPSKSPGIGKTTNGGATWTYLPLPDDYKNYGVSMVYAISRDTLFIPIFGNAGGNTYILKSTDGGKTWTQVLQGAQPGTSFFNVIHFFDSKHGIVQGDPVNGDFEIYVTSDGGDTWTRIDGANIPDALDGEYGTVGYYYGDSANIWFFTTKGRVFRSMDKGQTWDVKELVTPASFGDPENNDLASIAGAVRGDGVGILAETYIEYTSTDTNYHYYYYKTSDFGANWTQFTPNGTVGVEQIRIIPTTPYFISVGSGIHLSSDGENWLDLAPYYNLFYISSIDMGAPEYGYLGSSKWSFREGGWILGENRKAIPDYKTSVDRACTGNNVVFTNTSLGLVSSIEWDFGQDANPQTATGPGPHTVTYSTPGDKTITLTVTDPQGQQYILTRNFRVDGEVPAYIPEIQGDKTPLINKSYTYSVEDMGDKYRWTFPTLWSVNTYNDSSVATVTVKGDLGQQTISVTPYNGCGTGQTGNLIVAVVGGQEKPYPNPSSDYIYLENTTDATIYVFNYQGKLVEKIQSNSYLTVLNVADSKYTSGVYTVVIQDKDGNKRTVKILVVK